MCNTTQLNTLTYLCVFFLEWDTAQCFDNEYDYTSFCCYLILYTYLHYVCLLLLLLLLLLLFALICLSFCAVLVYCLFSAPPHQKEFLVGLCVNILGNKQDSDSDSDLFFRQNPDHKNPTLVSQKTGIASIIAC